MGTSPLDGFGITVGFTGERGVLGLKGEVDLMSASELAAVLSGLIDRGHSSVVLDLTELTFLDAAGLGVIATRAHRLDLLGGTLTIRSPSRLVVRILDVTGLTEVVRFEDPGPSPERLGPEQSGPRELDDVR